MVLKYFCLLLILAACLKKEDKLVQNKPIATQEVAEIGRETLVVDTVPPLFSGPSHFIFFNKYRISFPKVSSEKISLKDVSIIGVFHENEAIRTLALKSNIPEWSDANKHTFYQSSPEQKELNFEFETNPVRSFAIYEIQMTPRFFDAAENAPSEFLLEGWNGQAWVKVYEARNLSTDRIDLWSPHLATRFVILSPQCPEEKVADHLGTCQIKKISCSDIQSEFTQEKFPCALKVENEEIICTAISNESECRMKLYKGQNVSYCDVYKDYLPPISSRLEVYFAGKKVFEQFCSIPIQ